ncbi:hypothetical protein EJ05DRAFT_474441 [Pseudovirgaria hyperparasitica]|uniref:Uncharacterized protein n=1 Tax=Pseudovirgaria hyperparasitica TaxID=470096 RepID=A0A6A6WEJ8_9PEZI|nr:uncharacterized protein EJ05DRAFT_474441 [Pseudovirgaria hyperparasitica]KAF2760579.1 hypothetical protein EJ05DRAFT_474441 [Pseudovirgaria hyperparasitica]
MLCFTPRFCSARGTYQTATEATFRLIAIVSAITTISISSSQSRPAWKSDTAYVEMRWNLASIQGYPTLSYLKTHGLSTYSNISDLIITALMFMLQS